jgi:hypothetical protein
MLKQPIKLESNLLIRNAVETDCDEILRLINVGLILNFNLISYLFCFQELATFEKFPDQVRITSESKINRNKYFLFYIN